MQREQASSLLTVVGWLGHSPGIVSDPAKAAIRQCSSVFARPELKADVKSLNPSVNFVPFARPFSQTLDALRNSSQKTCIVASGDPGLFGLTRTLRNHGFVFDTLAGISSIQYLSAKLSLPWDDLAAVSFLRDDERVGWALVTNYLPSRNIALLYPPRFDTSPLKQYDELLGKGLRAWLGIDLATPNESITELRSFPDRAGQAATLIIKSEHQSGAVYSYDPYPPADPFHDKGFVYPGNNYTKLEVRMAMVAYLKPYSLRSGARVLEVGAGSGMVGLTLARLRPDIRLVQLEPDANRAKMARKNAGTCGLTTTVIETRVQCYDGSGFDAAIVGGGGIEALEATLARVPNSAPVVASYVDPARAGRAHQILGNLTMMEITELTPFAGGNRLAPRTPVFLAWR
jgi:precorrin-6Y C5,15-methyltransferase (decarboxylating)